MLNERGAIMLQVIFLTLIVSFTAMIFLNGASRVSENNSALRLVALNLAREQFAELERLANSGNLTASSYNFLGKSDLKNFGIYSDADLTEKIPVEFTVTSAVTGASENLRSVKVKVDWTVAEKNYTIEFEKLILVRKED